MNDEQLCFKAFLRLTMRQLKVLKEAIKNKDYERAETLIDELIEDTQNNIED